MIVLHFRGMFLADMFALGGLLHRTRDHESFRLALRKDLRIL